MEQPLREHVEPVELKAAPSQEISVPVRDVHSLEELEELLHAHSDKLVVVDCSAKLCGPCRMMDPVYESKAKHFKDALFCKIDTEENESTKAIMSSLGVRALPAFFAFRDEKMVGKCRGAQEKILNKMIVDNVHQGETGYVLPCFRNRKVSVNGGGPRSMSAGLPSNQPSARWSESMVVANSPHPSG